MLGEKVILKGQSSKTVDVETYKINDKFSVFKSTYKNIKDGTTISEKEDSGIALNNIIQNCISANMQVEHEQNIILLTPKLKELFKIYGFPSYFEHLEYVNPYTKEIEKPHEIFIQEVLNNPISIDLIEKDPDLLEQIVYCDFNKMNITNIKTGAYINTAVSLYTLSLNSELITDFNLMVANLIENKRIIYRYKEGQNKQPYFCHSEQKFDISHKVIFSDEEFDLLMGKEDPDNIYHASFFNTYKMIRDNDILNISQYF